MEGSLEMAAAVLLFCAGVAKLRFPRPAAAMLRRAWPSRRLTGTAPATVVACAGAAEVCLGAAAIVTGNRGTAVTLALWYAACTLVTVRLVRHAPATPCGCFGRSDSPVGAVHVVVNVACTAIAVAAAVRPPGTLGGVFAHGGLFALINGAQVLLLAYLGFLSITALPALTAARHRLEAR